MMAMKPAALTAAFVKAPEMADATVRAANATASMSSTMAASGELILETTDIYVFTGLLRRVDGSYLFIRLYILFEEVYVWSIRT